MFQLFYTWWRVSIYVFWWIVIIYSMIVLCLIYTFQFDQIQQSWRSISISDEMFDPASLNKSLPSHVLT